MTVHVEEIKVCDAESGPYAITTGPDGALWFTMVHAGRVGRLMPGSELRSYGLEPASCGPTVITAGPDGALWFTEYQGHRIGRITVLGETTRFALPTPEAGPFGIAAGPDGALWFTETAAGPLYSDLRRCPDQSVRHLYHERPPRRASSRSRSNSPARPPPGGAGG